jgi:hypothetical protein
MLGGGVRFCWRSVAPLRLGFPGGASNAEATMLQRNNFSELLPFSDGDLLDDNREAGETCLGVEGRRIVVFFFR